MIILLLFFAVLGVYLYNLIRPDARTKELGDRIPGPPPKPIVGNALDIPLAGPKCEKVHLEMFNKYGWNVKLWTGPKLVYVCTDCEDAEEILKSVTEIDKSFVYKYMKDWIGEGLLLSTGHKWHVRRKALTPSFHFQILDEFVDVFDKSSRTLVRCLAEHVEKGEFDLTPYVGAYTLDVITETSMKTNVNAQLDPNNTYVKANREIAQVICHRINSPWLLSDTLYRLSGHYTKEKQLISILRDHFYKIVENIKKSDFDESAKSDLGTKKKFALLPMLLKLKEENHPAFKTEEDIREEVETFVFEGHDTTTAGISFALGCLARHPEIQEKAYEEVKDILSGVDRITMNELNQLKYLERVIKETQRLYPSVPIVARDLKNETFLPSSGHLLPKGTMIAIYILYIHRNPKYFPNPNVFDPDNFLPENVEKRPNFSYVPFSSGPRNCIGQKFAMLEMKSALAHLLLNYEFSCEAGTPVHIPVSVELTLQSTIGHKIKISKR